jgi:hypothetical protein
VSTPWSIELNEYIRMLLNKGGEVGVIEDNYFRLGQYYQEEYN